MTAYSTEPDGMLRYQTFINGRWCDAAGGRLFDSFDPSTGRVWARLPRCDGSDVALATQAAHHAAFHGPWSGMRATERGRWLRRLGTRWRPTWNAWPRSNAATTASA